MKTKILLTAVILSLSYAAYAQQYTISFTTLNGAINATQTTLVLASAAASSGSSFGPPAAGQCLLVEGEFMTILGVASTTMTVRRATNGGEPNIGSATAAVGHPTGAVVWTAPCNAFKASSPTNLGTGLGSGQCALQPAPWIDIKTANIWWCNRTNNVWWGTNYITFAYGSVPTAQ